MIIEISVVVVPGMRAIEISAEHAAAIGGDVHGTHVAVVPVDEVDLPHRRTTTGPSPEQIIDMVERHIGLLRFLIHDGEGAFGIQVELVEVHRAAHTVGGRRAFADDFAALHFDFAHAAAGSRIVDHDLPHCGLGCAIVAADLDDVIENFLSIALAEDAQSGIGGICGLQRAKRKQNKPKEKCYFHRRNDETGCDNFPVRMRARRAFALSSRRILIQ